MRCINAVFVCKTPIHAVLLFLKVSEITDDLARLPKRAQLAAAFITYLSAAPEDQRKNSLDEWTKSAGLESNFVCVYLSVSVSK